MKKLTEFLEEFNISQSDFNSTGLDWDKLLNIEKDYETFKPELVPPANYLIEALHNVKEIHSVRFRIKNSSHLIAKIILNRLKTPHRIIDINNYRVEITDIIGLRALHLFKEDWLNIHQFITRNWNLIEDPKAYYRKGDSSDYVDSFKRHECKVEEHPFGYRSVHYLVKSTPNKTTYISEIQVRTIFEEGWSEIDHSVRYPYARENKLLNQFLVIFNRLAGSSDEMGSYVQYLKNELAIKENEFKEAVAKKAKIIEDLKGKIKELELKPKVAIEWENELDKILKLPVQDPTIFNFKLPDFYNIEIPDFSKISIPNYSNIQLPDFSHIRFPENKNSESPKKDLESKREVTEKKPKKEND